MWAANEVPDIIPTALDNYSIIFPKVFEGSRGTFSKSSPCVLLALISYGNPALHLQGRGFG